MNDLKSMILVKGTVKWTGNKKATFKMIPITADCPYLEAIFDPENLALGLVGKFKKSNYEMVPSLDENGDFQKKKRVVQEGEFPFKQEKRLVESWNEYEILTKDEILQFIELFAVNADTFDVEMFFNPIIPQMPATVKMSATVTAELEKNIDKLIAVETNQTTEA